MLALDDRPFSFDDICGQKLNSAGNEEAVIGKRLSNSDVLCRRQRHREDDTCSYHSRTYK